MQQRRARACRAWCAVRMQQPCQWAPAAMHWCVHVCVCVCVCVHLQAYWGLYVGVGVGKRGSVYKWVSA